MKIQLAVLLTDIHSYDADVAKGWIAIPKSTIGEITESILVPLSTTYRLRFKIPREDGSVFVTEEFVNEKDLKIIDKEV